MRYSFPDVKGQQITFPPGLMTTEISHVALVPRFGIIAERVIAEITLSKFD